LVVKYRDILKMTGPEGKRVICPISYLRGMVSERGEGMAGHHAAWTMGLIDEASGVPDLVYTQMETWARHIFVFGNPNPTTNFFFMNVEAGDLKGSDVRAMAGVQ
jgi:hypothetical protein